MQALSNFKRNFLGWFAIILMVGIGIFLRIHSFEPTRGGGFDEKMYVRYTKEVSKVGVAHLPEIFELYVEDQSAASIAFLPPTRVCFILASTGWHALFGTDFLPSIKGVSAAASVVFLLFSIGFAYRLAGKRMAAAMALLMAFAPTQIYMAHAALVDGFFAMMALGVVWALWEVLQKPTSLWRLFIYGLALALMVLTKENAAFVYLAVLGILAACRFFHYGTVTRYVLLTTFLGASFGFAVLVLCAGGPRTLFEVLTLNVQKSLVLPYAFATGDGPWFRYLSDMFLVSPVVMMLTFGGVFRMEKADREAIFLFCFVLFSYVFMANVRYGINLRYALIWDFPFRFLAIFAIGKCLANLQNARKKQVLWLLSLSVVAFSELANYHRIFITHGVYDLVPVELLKGLNVIKVYQ